MAFNNPTTWPYNVNIGDYIQQALTPIPGGQPQMPQATRAAPMQQASFSPGSWQPSGLLSQASFTPGSSSGGGSGLLGSGGGGGYLGPTHAALSSAFQQALGQQAGLLGANQGGVTPDAINSIYNSLLGRNADPGGLNFYLNSGAGLGQIQSSIMNSPEYQRTSYTPTPPANPYRINWFPNAQPTPPSGVDLSYSLQQALNNNPNSVVNTSAPPVSAGQGSDGGAGAGSGTGDSGSGNSASADAGGGGGTAP